MIFNNSYIPKISDSWSYIFELDSKSAGWPFLQCQNCSEGPFYRARGHQMLYVADICLYFDVTWSRPQSELVIKFRTNIDHVPNYKFRRTYFWTTQSHEIHGTKKSLKCAKDLLFFQGVLRTFPFTDGLQWPRPAFTFCRFNPFKGPPKYSLQSVRIDKSALRYFLTDIFSSYKFIVNTQYSVHLYRPTLMLNRIERYNVLRPKNTKSNQRKKGNMSSS
jgi:hypothetical protein